MHSDIKPENIFFNVEAQRFVIGDFDSMQKQGEHVLVKGGTHGWLPEGVVGNANHVANIGDDWYSFHMIIAWIRGKGNGRPIKGETYLDTEEIFSKAQEKKEILQQEPGKEVEENGTGTQKPRDVKRRSSNDVSAGEETKKARVA